MDIEWIISECAARNRRPAPMEPPTSHKRTSGPLRPTWLARQALEDSFRMRRHSGGTSVWVVRGDLFVDGYSEVTFRAAPIAGSAPVFQILGPDFNRFNLVRCRRHQWHRWFMEPRCSLAVMTRPPATENS